MAIPTHYATLHFETPTDSQVKAAHVFPRLLVDDANSTKLDSMLRVIITHDGED